MEGDVVDRTRAAAKATDQLVHENPWQSIALATAVGFLVGVVVAFAAGAAARRRLHDLLQAQVGVVECYTWTQVA